METSPLFCSANQWTGFYMITASVMKGLMEINQLYDTTNLLNCWIFSIFLPRFPFHTEYHSFTFIVSTTLRD